MLERWNNSSNNFPVENDATLAKSACAVGYAYQRKLEAYGHCSEVVSKAVKMLSEVIIIKLEKLHEILDRCKSMSKLTESQLNFFKLSHEHQLKILDLFSNSSREGSMVNSDANGSIQVRVVYDLVIDGVIFKGALFVGDNRAVFQTSK